MDALPGSTQLPQDKSYINCLALDKSNLYAICGDTQGSVLKLDLRMGRPMARLRGPSGSIRCIDYHPLADQCPYIVSAGLDRFLYIHHKDTNQLLQRLYVKQKIASCLFSSELKTDAKQTSENKEEDDENQKEEEIEHSISGKEEVDDEENPPQREPKKRKIVKDKQMQKKWKKE
jgi:ribosome biogenesis protein NSA1